MKKQCPARGSDNVLNGINKNDWLNTYPNESTDCKRRKKLPSHDLLKNTFDIKYSKKTLF